MSLLSFLIGEQLICKTYLVKFVIVPYYHPKKKKKSLKKIVGTHKNKNMALTI